METTTRVPFESLPSQADDECERSLAEIDVAIALVSDGGAVRVRVVGLAEIDAIAAIAVARAQDAGVAFSVDRSPTGFRTVTVGPRT